MSEAALPPFDLVDEPLLDRLPQVPGATVLVHARLTGGPGGDVDFTQSIIDGRIASILEGWVGDPDVRLQMTLENYLRLRLGECNVIEALEGGHLQGDQPWLSVLAGVIESPEHVAAWQANRQALQAMRDAWREANSVHWSDPGPAL